MTAQTILPANSVTASGYDVANSLRFNDGSADRLQRTQDTADSRKKFTLSYWIKKTNNARIMVLHSFNSGNYIYHDYENDRLSMYSQTGATLNFNVTPTRLFRDPSAWYHIVIAVDTTQGTAANRMKIYVNGVQETVFTNSTYPGENHDCEIGTTSHLLNFGAYNVNSSPLDGYLAEVVLIDNQALAPDQFGEFDEDSGIWKPIKVSGLTFGTNGSYLEFKESGTSANASGMGADTSGNANHFAVANLTAVDQSTDTCTNNFATLNPLNNYWAAATFTQGNTVYTSNNSSEYYGVSTSTIGVASGKWYFEAKNSTNTDQGILGITSRTQTGRGTWLGSTSQAYGYYSTGGVIRSSASDTSYGASYTANDIIGIYLDLDNNLMYVSDNGSLQNSGTGHAITAAALTDSGFYHLAVGDNSDNTQVWQVNFGGTSGFAISSGNADDNGYGNFEYSPNITGDSVAKKFYALCSKNVAEFG